MKLNHSQPSKALEPKTINLESISSPVLKRLIEEVKLEGKNSLLSYNRQHNRHNRGR